MAMSRASHSVTTTALGDVLANSEDVQVVGESVLHSMVPDLKFCVVYGQLLCCVAARTC